MSTDPARDRPQASINPQQSPVLDSSGAGRINNRTASAPRRLSMLCLAVLCTAAGGSSPDTTLIVGPRVELATYSGHHFDVRLHRG